MIDKGVKLKGNRDVMPVSQKDGTVQEGGEIKKSVTFTFTNAAKEQLQELQKFLKVETTLEVVKIAISQTLIAFSSTSRACFKL